MMFRCEYDSFEALDQALRDGALIVLTGRLAGRPTEPNALETVLDEMPEIWVIGVGGWRAMVRRRGRAVTATPIRV